MMRELFKRRQFIKTTAAAGIGLGMAASPVTAFGKVSARSKKIGIIGLDTSHSVAFTKLINDPAPTPDVAGYKVVAAYPHGSRDIESSASRIPKLTREVKELGVEIVASIDELLKKVDFVMLETNDGRLHLEQALPVLKAGKRMFIDKPVAASLSDAMAIYEASKKYGVPIFSSSSLRYMSTAQDIASGKTVGKVIGAHAYSPAKLEKTHPDLFWYGVHGVEALFTVMGTGCKSVVRVHTDDTDVVTGTWEDGRIGSFRGIRSGKNGYGGTAFGEKGIAAIGPYEGYRPLLVEVLKFFKTGNPPVSAGETLEIFAFMEAADESMRQGDVPVTLDSVFLKARENMANVH